MKKNQVTIGNVYTAKVSGNLASVRITSESPQGGWWGLNLDTNRKVRVKTAGRLHRQIADPDDPAAAGETAPETTPETVPAEQEIPETQEQQAASDEPTTDGEQALEPQANEEPQAAPEAAQAADTPPEQPTPDHEPEATTKAPSGGDALQEKPLSKVTVEELQAKYLEVVGRSTGSSNRNYLIWKVKQAMKGRIPVGPRTSRSAAGPCRVLPLRMETELVEQLDEARKRLGLSSRMDLFRRSLHAFLIEAGEVRVAELFSPTPEA